MTGVLCVNKPRGITSHDAVDKVRYELQTRRVGHAGTLDPICEGVLVMGVGYGTRFLQYLQLEPKIYEGEMTLGIETDTQDSEGTVVSEMDASNITLEDLRHAASRFVGRIQQVPPMFSAMKIGGKRLYKRARRGETMERPPKSVQVHEFEILRLCPSDEKPSNPRAAFRVVCSTGTYVRTLVHDVGRALGVGAHLGSLTRTAVGRFKLSDAVPLSEVSPECVIPLDKALEPMPMVRLSEDQVRSVRNGVSISVTAPKGSGYVGLLDAKGCLFAVAKSEFGMLHPVCVIPLGAEG